MNIFKKIALINKISKKVKAVKKYLEYTHIDEELKQLVENLKNDLTKLGSLIPAAKGLIEDILELIKE